MSSQAISVEDLSYSYGSNVVLKGISFSVAPNQIFCLLGVNGAGKTTTIDILEGYKRAQSGSVEVLGLDPYKQRRELKPRVGMMLQEGGIYPGIRVIEAMKLFASYYDDSINTDEIFELTGLGPLRTRIVRSLSGGEKQRLNLGLALIGRPSLVFLDEPTSGMDPIARASMWTGLASIRDSGTTVMLTTHALQEAEFVADTVGILHDGKMVALGTVAELTTAADQVEFTTDKAIDVAPLQSFIGSKVSGGGRRYTVHSPASDVVARLSGYLESIGISVVELSTGRRSLESIFLEITRNESE